MTKHFEGRFALLSGKDIEPLEKLCVVESIELGTLT
ncbi:MAG: hypothetical protein H6Q78_608, partial [Candidatus Krumholzibacteriota bacterium]|nr:hypothetical protein [Candidatus Krumholzibacteriota bacterium]